MSITSYEDAGVSIEKGDRFAQFIANSQSKAVSKTLGGFAGGIEIDIEKFKKPVMLSATDGVGTKILVAQELQKFDTLGIDLVAMCVNDLIVCGAEPLVFLDYIACGGINEAMLQSVIQGVIQGCEDADCTLAGGETAEMPDLYKGNDFDLAGFSVGLVEKSQMLPKQENMKEGDLIMGLPSTGIHSNGLSLARKVLDKKDWGLLLPPTKIYVKDLRPFLDAQCILGAAHITGGGLEGNLARVYPSHLEAAIDYTWDTPEVFKKIQKQGNISEDEMRKVFNMGIGMAVIVSRDKMEDFFTIASQHNISCFPIGELRLG